MANVFISPEMASELQQNLIFFHKVGAGRRLPLADVRAAMLIRANSHLLGISGAPDVLPKKTRMWPVKWARGGFVNFGKQKDARS